jgi:hypothetical protein
MLSHLLIQAVVRYREHIHKTQAITKKLIYDQIYQFVVFILYVVTDGYLWLWTVV